MPEKIDPAKTTANPQPKPDPRRDDIQKPEGRAALMDAPACTPAPATEGARRGT